MADLASSIRDGRYAEQSYRLADYPIHNHNIVYLIEGNLSNFGMNPYSNFNRKNPINKKTLRSTMLSVMYYKGFCFHKFASLVETAEVIMQMTDKIMREQDKKIAYYANGANVCKDEVGSISKEYKGDGVVMTGGENSKISDLDLVIAPKVPENGILKR